MPYKSVNELPEQTKSLSSHQKKIFMRAFNASYKKYGEKRAFKIAWAAVKKAGNKERVSSESRVLINEKLNFYAPIAEEMGEVSDSNKVQIVGTAINSTVTRNNIKYTVDELKAATISLKNKNLFMGHDTNPAESVGVVNEAWFDKDNGRVRFKADVFNTATYPDMTKRIKNKLIQNVSIGADAKKLEEIEVEEKLVRKAEGIEFLELSFVGIPGDKNATFTQAVAEKFDNLEEDGEESEDSNEEEESEMEEDNKVDNKINEELESLKKQNEELNKFKENVEREKKLALVKELKEAGYEASEEESVEVLEKMAKFAKKVEKSQPQTEIKEDGEGEEDQEEDNSEDNPEEPSAEEKAKGYRIVEEKGEFFGKPLEGQLLY